jgi:hypothetical protein
MDGGKVVIHTHRQPFTLRKTRGAYFYKRLDPRVIVKPRLANGWKAEVSEFDFR